MTAGLISIAETGEVRERFGYRALMIVGVRDDGMVDVMSHARDRADCDIIGRYAQQQFGTHLPMVPFQTWFGWGSAGVPLALTEAQLAELGHAGKLYAIANTHPHAVRS